MNSDTKPMTVPTFRAAKSAGRKLAVVTAYDYTSALIAEAAGTDAILVGDSLGMVVQGHSTSIPVSLSHIVYHTKCVVRGTKRVLVIADMPFGSYQSSPAQAVRNAVRLIKAGAHAVKVEGGRRMAPVIAALVAADIPVMGHVGLTPQSVHALGGFKVQRDEKAILDDALAVELAGAFSLVVECVPTALADQVTQRISIPTIGIGAGPVCNGQVLVWHDLLGLYDAVRPKFVKRYAELGRDATAAVKAYCDEVRNGTFPGPSQQFQ
ncbi:MAG: 3-methyl-2-oxobutanoate hydroxymethyltransferase [Gemmataceae bacterium]